MTSDRKRCLKGLRSLTHTTYSIWLFTRSDLKTIVLPSTAFGVSNALAGSAYDIQPSIYHLRQPLVAMQVAGIVCFWVWINLLPFDIDNQLSPQSISEDIINKPWRPLPSRRMTPAQAGSLRLPLYVCALATSWKLGGFRQSLMLVGLGIWYNHGGGSDSHALIRNLINGAGYVCFASGALEVALGNIWLEARTFPWFLIIGLVVFSTVQTQDFHDQAGDIKRNRKTLPLQMGDGPSRFATAILIVFWSIFCVRFWRLPMVIHLVFLVYGSCIAFRLLRRRSVAHDKMTFRLWNLWMVSLYTLPLLLGFLAR